MKTGKLLWPLFLLVLAFLGPAGAQPLGTFAPTGPMIKARAGHTATLLFDGRVLIVGGADAYFSEIKNDRTAEIYDPITGTFTSTGDLPEGHTAISATLLADGRVLIVGILTAALYDPSSGVFTPTGSPVEEQYGHQATLLANGQVLISGGGPIRQWEVANRAELYDPPTGTFRLAASYVPVPQLGAGDNGLRGGATALLSNGEILLSTEPLSQIYSPTKDTFDVSGSMTQDRHPLLGKATNVYGRAATVLPNGKVLLTGGSVIISDTTWNLLAGTEIYDRSTGEFTATGSMRFPRYSHTSTLLPDGAVFIAGGGVDDFGGGSAETEIYNPTSGSFVSGGAMTATRAAPRATLLNDGRVLISGGEFVGPQFAKTVTNSSEIYTPPSPKAAPVLLSLSGDGRGQGAIQHSNTARIASASDPAAAGDYLSIYLVGMQQQSVIPPRVSIGGKLAEVTYFGSLAAYPGLFQINARVPSGIAPGGAVPVRLMYLNQISNEVTIGVR